MSQENVVGVQKPVSLKPVQVMVCGRIEQIRSFNGTRYTRTITPVSDAYSRPQVVEVRTKQKLGEKGDEVMVVYSLGGYQRKPYQFKNKDTDEVETIVPVGHVLDVVEV